MADTFNEARTSFLAADAESDVLESVVLPPGKKRRIKLTYKFIDGLAGETEESPPKKPKSGATQMSPVTLEFPPEAPVSLKNSNPSTIYRFLCQSGRYNSKNLSVM